MKFASALTAFALAFNLGNAFSWQAWTPAGANDGRSPCPGLNTLANHAYINHNGSDIQRADLINALMSVYNLDSGISAALTDGALNSLGRTSTNGVVLDLKALNKHNAIEHDASLSRKDLGDTGSDNFSVQRSLVDQLKGLSSDGTVLTWCNVATARNLRVKQESASDPDFSFSLKQGAIALAEASLVVEVFGNGKNVSVDNIESFFWKEQIPTGWTQPVNALGAATAAKDVIYLKGLTLIC